MITVLVASFLITVFSGPAFDEERNQRKRRRDMPTARVTYLPSSVCRSHVDRRNQQR